MPGASEERCWPGAAIISGHASRTGRLDMFEIVYEDRAGKAGAVAVENRMTKLKDRSQHDPANVRFTMDASYFRQQAREAFRTFLAPLSGVYDAVVQSEDRAAASQPRTVKPSRLTPLARNVHLFKDDLDRKSRS